MRPTALSSLPGSDRTKEHHVTDRAIQLRTPEPIIYAACFD